MNKFLLILILLLSVQATEATDTVRVGAFNFYPGIFLDTDGEVKGFYVDALKEIEEKEDIKFKYIYGSWSEGLQRIKSGDVDMLTSVAYTKERAEYMDYTAHPKLTVWGEVYVKDDSEIHGILNLEGKTIAIMKGDFNGEHLIRSTKKFNINCNYIETTDFESVFEMVKTGRVDAGVVNNTYGAPKNTEYNLRSSGIIFNPFDIYFTVKKGENKELLSMMNRYLNKWVHDEKSVFNKARQKWSHGNIGKIEVLPQWINRALWLSAIVLLVLLSFILLLRHRVRVATEKVKESEALFRIFMENMTGYVYIKDEKLKHIYNNLLTNGAMGYGDFSDPEQKIDFGKEGTELIEKADRQVLYSDTPQTDIIYSCKRGDEFIWLHDFKFRIDMSDGRKLVGGIAFDITNLKKTEKELIKARDKAEESNLLKTAFLNNLSHEIRTPLNAISGFSNFLIKPNLPTEKRQYFNSVIQNSTEQLVRIVNDVLTISFLETDQESLRNEVFNLNLLIEDLLPVHRLKTEENGVAIDLVASLPDDEVEIFADKVKLTQILSNLITNAVKFTSKGSISIGYLLSENESGRILKFFVKDTGIGIAKENLKVIFERFRQEDNSISKDYGGTGLGLAISKGFVELMGGDIYAESEKGQGTTFYFTIPYRSEPQSQEEEREPVTLSGEHTILIAEDALVNYLYIKEELADMPINFIHASNGIDAVKFCRENTKIELVLMDIKMPGMNGIDAANEIRLFNPILPIIAQTAYATEQESEVHKNAFDAILTKPINASQLRNTVSRFLQEKSGN
jgi:signal transduction histidine kinase/ABC-type amino acid transport substrate-binding protein